MNKHQLPTRYIKHLAESANFNGSTFNKHRNGLIGNRFEMPNVSYTHPLSVSVKSRPANGTFGFSRHTSQRSKNQKSHFFANARTDNGT